MGLRRLALGLGDEFVGENELGAGDAGQRQVDLTALGWGDNPAVKILRDARVALHFGPLFGEEGRGHVRINFGCSPGVLRLAVERMGTLVGS